mmetsp:Transcript_37175/g.72517  ORF Transcript_37175/g.72517 Transcript_37175/m.72517 type:complete len:286 (-) Transcript_37175:633-1490(-)
MVALERRVVVLSRPLKEPQDDRLAGHIAERVGGGRVVPDDAGPDGILDDALHVAGPFGQSEGDVFLLDDVVADPALEDHQVVVAGALLVLQDGRQADAEGLHEVVARHDLQRREMVGPLVLVEDDQPPQPRVHRDVRDHRGPHPEVLHVLPMARMHRPQVDSAQVRHPRLPLHHRHLDSRGVNVEHDTRACKVEALASLHGDVRGGEVQPEKRGGGVLSHALRHHFAVRVDLVEPVKHHTVEARRRVQLLSRDLQQRVVGVDHLQAVDDGVRLRVRDPVPVLGVR